MNPFYTDTPYTYSTTLDGVPLTAKTYYPNIATEFEANAIPLCDLARKADMTPEQLRAVLFFGARLKGDAFIKICMTLNCKCGYMMQREPNELTPHTNSYGKKLHRLHTAYERLWAQGLPMDGTNRRMLRRVKAVLTLMEAGQLLHAAQWRHAMQNLRFAREMVFVLAARSDDWTRLTPNAIRALRVSEKL